MVLLGTNSWLPGAVAVELPVTNPGAGNWVPVTEIESTRRW